MYPEINSDRLWQRLLELSNFTDPALPWTRRAFSAEFQNARQWLWRAFEQAGLQVRLDGAGNLVGRREGCVAGLKPLVTGSHSDTVLAGGRFDGVLGVVAGLEVLQSLHEQGVVLRHPVELLDFLGEEPSDHGVSCIGSRAFGGHLDTAMLAQCDAEGESLAHALARAGGRPQALAEACRGPDSIAAFVELHIEQGPVLECEGMDIGVVTHIVGIRRFVITVIGRADHAGTTPMHVRQDALAGASVLVTAAQGLATESGLPGGYVVATVGRLALTPNAPNSVPGRVEMTLEVRSNDDAVLGDFMPRLMAQCSGALACLRVRIESVQLTATRPTACSVAVMRAIEKAADRLRLRHRRLPSGAGHDAVHVSATGPVGMVFVPCRGGRSHCPEEWLEPAQAAAGARVLAHTLVGLDRQLSA